jgi:hypothetical protein
MNNTITTLNDEDILTLSQRIMEISKFITIKNKLDNYITLLNNDNQVNKEQLQNIEKFSFTIINEYFLTDIEIPRSLMNEIKSKVIQIKELIKTIKNQTIGG